MALTLEGYKLGEGSGWGSERAHGLALSSFTFVLFS